MKRLLFILAIFCTLKANAQPYSISFAGDGLSSVKVENLTSGLIVNLSAGDVLHLSGTTGISEVENNKSSELKIYPNPMYDKSTLEVLPPVAGDAIISVYEITGKVVTQIKSYLGNYVQTFTLSDLRNGLYVVNIKGYTYELSVKLLCNGQSNGKASIETTGNNLQTVKGGKFTVDTKGTQATVVMAYSTGDTIKFTGISGIYSTVMTDIPSSNKTITFNFIACTDGDNNNYPVVQIGTQIWMAENLKTTKYNDGTSIPNVIIDSTWVALTTGAYCDYGNNPANYSTTYGRLYNWYVVDNNAATKVASNGSKNVCPIGWHVPSDAEWTTLTTYLGGEWVAGGKLKETYTTHWLAPNTGATNETGFTALPGGNRLTLGGSYGYMGSYGGWWSSTEYTEHPPPSAWHRYMRVFHHPDIDRVYSEKSDGFSVRCVRD